jgi:hypothetical protein
MRRTAQPWQGTREVWWYHDGRDAPQTLRPNQGEGKRNDGMYDLTDQR